MPHPVMGNTMTLSRSREGTRKSAEVRSRRRQLREELKKQTDIDVAEILDRDEDYIQFMRVEYLVRSLPGIGKIKATEIMDELDIPSKKRIRHLGSRQREALLEILPKYSSKIRRQ